MKRKLGDICKIVSGTTPKTGCPEYWDGDIKWITPAEIHDDTYIVTDTERKITELGVRKTGLSPFPAGTVILSSRAPIGKVAIAGCEMYCNQGFKNLICSEKIHNKYLYWFLKGKKEFLNTLGRGATFKEISKAIVEQIEIELPDFAQQIRIAAIFESLRSLLLFRRPQLSALDELVKVRFVEMFGDENNSKEWPIVSVDSVADSTVGVVIKPAQYYTDAEHGERAFRSLNVGPMCIKDASWVYFSREGHAKNAKSQLRENDLLVVRSGAPGTACVVPRKYAGSNAIDVIIVRPDTTKVNPHYLCMFTNLPHGKRQIDDGVGGAAQQHFNVGKYSKLRLMLPPLALQNRFATFVSRVESAKTSVKRALGETQTLFDRLMQEFFGKVSNYD